MLKRKLILTLIALLLGGVSVKQGHGKEYPARPIEIYNPYAAGSSSDLMSRVIADMASKYLGQPLAVVNKTGAGGSLAAAEVIGSKPDGYKLLAATSSFFAITTKTQKVPFDPSHLVPIANFIEFKEIGAVRGDSPWKTFSDLLDYARKNPGKLRWAHSGRGIFQHMVALSIFRRAGVETIDIPYRGGNPEKQAALLGGHVDASYFAYGGVAEQIRAGKIRGLIVIRDRRYSDLPDVPCAAELGFSEEAKLNTLVGLFAHKDTPGDIKRILFDAFKKASDDPEFKKRIEKIGEEPRFGGPELINDTIRRVEEASVPILKELGLFVGK